MFKLGCELIKGNFDGNMKGEKGEVEDKTAGSDSRQNVHPDPTQGMVVVKR